MLYEVEVNAWRPSTQSRGACMHATSGVFMYICVDELCTTSHSQVAASQPGPRLLASGEPGRWAATQPCPGSHWMRAAISSSPQPEHAPQVNINAGNVAYNKPTSQTGTPVYGGEGWKSVDYNYESYSLTTVREYGWPVTQCMHHVGYKFCFAHPLGRCACARRWPLTGWWLPSCSRILGGTI